MELPEVSCCCHLTNKYWKAGEDGAAVGPCSSLKLQHPMEVAAQQVELSGLEVLQRLHGTPDTLGDLQEKPDLCCHVIELSLTF